MLLLRGARQVGKTWSARKLGESFPHFLEVNFDEIPEVARFWEGALTPGAIVEQLSAYFDVPVIPGKTLLFLDEIQACPNALRSLRYFYEKMPDLHVIGAGSLLAFSLDQIPSFGVGRITSLYMYPLTFYEFLDAVGGGGLRSMVSKPSQEPLADPIHNKLLEKYRIYQMIGGLPAVVAHYSQNSDLRGCRNLLDNLVTSYQDDFAKYKKRSPVLKIQEVFQAVPFQAGRKFKYVDVAGGEKTHGYRDALDLLIKAGLAYKIHHTSARGIPLGAQVDPRKFKVILFDLGIHQNLLGLDFKQGLLPGPETLINKGPVAECFAGLEVIAQSSRPPGVYYWHREARSSNAEVDYVIQIGKQIVPIEIKSSRRGQMQSMHLFLADRPDCYGVRASHENFGAMDRIRIMPLYAVSNLVRET
ncbi:MAG: ATP-binding protein [Acidobacteriota bacterium]|nr:ATP-binding protein [Acidobacteriota bacterium]